MHICFNAVDKQSPIQSFAQNVNFFLQPFLCHYFVCVTELLQISYNGDLKKVEQLLKESINVNCTNKVHKRCILMYLQVLWSCMVHKSNCVKCLTEHFNICISEKVIAPHVISAKTI